MMLGMIEILEKLNIRYLVTGGMAVVVWGKPRFTADIDLVVELTSEILPRLQTSLEQFCEKGMIDFHMMQQALKACGEFNYIDADSDVKVDFWVAGNTTFDRIRFDRRIRREIAGHSLWFISPEDLVLMKLKWMQKGSYRSIDDVVSILSSQKEKLDWNYIQSWVEKLDLKKEMEIAKGLTTPS